jgi:hypothetical protein
MIEFIAGLTVFDAFGLLGFAVYLSAFGALQFEWLDGNGRTYAWANIFAASFVLVSLVEAFNLASALIQISWIIVGYVGIVRRRGREDMVGRSVPA